MNTVRREFDTFVAALRFFTRLPLPGEPAQGGIGLERAIRYFPACGLVVGGLAALVFAFATFFWAKTLAVLAAMATAIHLTGALHEDGWTDTVDGLGGGRDRAHILAIMRDSCVGSFGAVALIVLLLARCLALVEMDALQVPLALIGGHALSRLCATLVLARLDYARPEGKAKPFNNQLGRGELAFAAVYALLPLLFLSPAQSIPGVLLALLVTLWLERRFKQGIGGYTGDTLGATQQAAELAFYVGLLCRVSPA